MNSRKWAIISITGAVVYIVLDAVLQTLQPQNNLFRDAESLLAIGPYGFLMNINFFVRGILSLSIIMALRDIAREPSVKINGLPFFTVWGAGSFLLGIFNTDKPNRVAMHVTFHGIMHLFLAAAAFLCAPVGAIMISSSLRKIGRLAAVRVPAMAVGIISAVFLVAMFLFGRGTHLGLFERLFIGSVLVWVVIVASGVLRGTRRILNSQF